MAKRSSSSLFSPTHRHHALRRGSGSGGSSTMSPSSAPWSRKENALLVQAWRDVAEHPRAALESVDAFQTRLFLRFQEVSGVGANNNGDDDDTVSMAGSECSMDSMDGSEGAYFARPARTQTSVVLKTYALRRMAAFIADFIAKQEKKRILLLEKETMQPTTEGEEVEMREASSEEQQSQEGTEEEDNAPVNWFALSKNDQIERFQKAGASNYIELDEHVYNSIQTILELQDKCKQEATPAASGINSANGGNGSAAPPQNPWSEKEVRHVLDAWRDSHLRTPTKLPGGDSFYARFIARNGENSQRSKPEVADTKIALMNMQRVIEAFRNRAPTKGKTTRGNLKRQRQNWFTLSLAEKQQAFAKGGNNQGCRFVDISEDMYETVSDLMGVSTAPMMSSFSSSSSSSPSSGGGGDVTPEPSKRRSIQTKVGTSNASSDMTRHSIQTETIDLISDDDSSIEEENEDEKRSGREETAGAEAVSTSSQEVDDDVAQDEGDVDMEKERAGDSSSSTGAADTLAETSTSVGLVSTGAGSGEGTNPGGDVGTDRNADPETAAEAAADHDLDADMDANDELKEPAHVHEATENDVEAPADGENCGKDGSSLETASIDRINRELEALDRVASFELELTSPHKKQKLEDPEVAAMMRGLEKQAQHLNDLVRQVQTERDQEREERKKLLKAIKVDQHGREAVLELLRIEQDERRHDRDERRKVLQILLHEQQKRQKEKDCSDNAIGGNAKFKVKDEDMH